MTEVFLEPFIRKCLCCGLINGIPVGLILLVGLWGFPEICAEWNYVCNAATSDDTLEKNNDVLMTFIYFQLGFLLLFGLGQFSTFTQRSSSWNDNAFVVFDSVCIIVGGVVWFVIGTVIFVMLAKMNDSCLVYNGWIFALVLCDILLLTFVGTAIFLAGIFVICLLFLPIMFIVKSIVCMFIPTKPNDEEESNEEERI